MLPAPKMQISGVAMRSVDWGRSRILDRFPNAAGGVRLPRRIPGDSPMRHLAFLLAPALLMPLAALAAELIKPREPIANRFIVVLDPKLSGGLGLPLVDKLARE